MKNEEEIKINRSLYHIGAVLVLILLLLFGMVQLLHINIQKFLLPCIFQLITGLYCPGCGGTRAVKALLDGDILMSFVYHPLVLYGGVLFGWFMLSHTLEILSGGRLLIGMNYKNWYLWIGIAIIIINFILKNLVLIMWGIPLLN